MFIRAQGRSQNQSFPGRTPSLRATPRANGDIQLLQLFFGSQRVITLESSVYDCRNPAKARPVLRVKFSVHATPDQSCISYRLKFGCSQSAPPGSRSSSVVTGSSRCPPVLLRRTPQDPARDPP